METEIPNFIIEMIEKQYGQEVTRKIKQGYMKKRFTTLRVNTLKATTDEIEKNLQKEKINYEKIKWYNEAFIIKNANEKDIRKLEMYEKGKIYLQSLSSMLPPILLEPKEGEDILDMAAAPGGKTTQIAAITKNKAHITACEINKIRAERLKYNIEKQGANVYVMNEDARKIDDFFSFDEILLDAPCSGSGTLDIKNITEELIKKSINLQTALLKKAIKLLKKGKEMIYSTCSILSCENEEIIQKILQEKKIEIVPISKKEKIQQLPLLPTKIDGTICVCPNKYYEGFFIAKIRKI